MDDHFLFYVAPGHIVDNHVRFPDEEARHISKVLRKRPDDLIQVTDGTGSLMTVQLISVDKKEANGKVVDRKYTPIERERILALGVIRQRDRLEFAVEKAVELGITRLVLVHSDHAEKVSVKASRIDKIIVSAMKQCQRIHLPVWEESESFSDTIAQYRNNCQIIMAHPDGTNHVKWLPKQPTDHITAGKTDSDIKPDNVNLNPENTKPQLLIVGPEGGFSASEVAQAIHSGAELVSLGSARLRAETAVCVLLTRVSFY